MIHRQVFWLLTLLGLSSRVAAQCGLQSGPMPGASHALEVTVWMQTACSAQVDMIYWSTDQPGVRHQSDPVTTVKSSGFTAHLVADKVVPNTRYEYRIRIDGAEIPVPFPTRFRTQQLWPWWGPAEDFAFLAGSCTYINEEAYDRPGRSYGGGYEIFGAMAREEPDFMVWLGDNIYLKEADWNSRTGIYYRYTHTRSLPELQPLLAATHHYATWDDHDYGPNNADRNYWMKDVTLQAFKDFWANPNYGAGGTEGITGTFFWADCQFFILDDRWYKTISPGTDYFGRRQLEWLVESLRTSSASYKFICTGGQVLSDATYGENMAAYAAERRSLLDSLDKYNIPGVIFLTGDHHHAEVTELTTSDGDKFVDITASPLTSAARPHEGENNTLRVPGSVLVVRNYARIEVTGPATDRVCKVTFRDGEGKDLFTYTTAHGRKM